MKSVIEVNSTVVLHFDAGQKTKSVDTAVKSRTFKLIKSPIFFFKSCLLKYGDIVPLSFRILQTFVSDYLRDTFS